MRLRLVLALGAMAIAGPTAVVWPRLDAPIAQPQAATTLGLPELAPHYSTTSHEVVEGETASEVLRGLGVEADLALAAAGRKLDRLSIGDTFHVDRRADLDHIWRIRVETAAATMYELAWNGEKYLGSDRPVPYRITSGARELVVESSLWDAALTAGLRPSQIVNIAKIFEYDVDFNTELQKGARIGIVADTLTADDGTVRVGDVRAARLENGKKVFTAIRFTMADGSVGWFAPDGTGRRRSFLRSPLEFSRVTSGFSTGRYHPILKVKRPHNGVDFGAPTGTPVRTVADGIVTTAGVSGGHGNQVAIQHEKPYATSYSHLSKILVKKGQKVRQGDVIGRVGSTGLATGPHLHYQFYVNGQYRDPMTVPLPMTGTLPEGEKSAFFAVRDETLPLLSAAEPAE